MVRTLSPPVEDSLPAGISLAALHAPGGSPLRLCAAYRKSPGLEKPGPVVVRERFGSRVLLGAICDARGHVQQWVELWVQSASGLAQSPAAASGLITNSVLDEQWRRRFAAMERADSAAIVRTGWETEHPPLLLNPSNDRPANKSKRGGERGEVDEREPLALRLCTDDALLGEHELPAYSTGLHRYLMSGEGDARVFVPVTDGAPQNERTRALESVVAAGDEERMPINVECGLMIVRRFEPFSFEQFLHELGGESAPPGGAGGGLSGIFSIAGLGAAEAVEGGESARSCSDRLLLSRHDPRGMLLEVFHLKLRLLADAVSAVQRQMRYTQAPILDLRDESFRVGLAERACGLPRLWTARCSLVEPAEAVAMPLHGTELVRFVRSATTPPSVYFPGAGGSGDAAGDGVRCTPPAAGSGVIRVRHVIEERGGRNAVVQGTFATQERLAAIAPTDLVWMRVPTPVGRVDLYAMLEKDSALAPGEWRFDTATQRLSPEAINVLRDGPPSHAIEFDLIPDLSAPVDLYALAVLAVRTLLVDAETTLPRALDEVMSLARQVSADAPEAVDRESHPPLAERIRAAFSDDTRWLSAIGPQRLWLHETTVEQALVVVQEELWCAALAAIIRAIPGACPESACRNFGDAPAGALHSVFEAFLADLDSLILWTRSQIVMDASANREIQEVLDLCLRQQ